LNEKRTAPIFLLDPVRDEPRFDDWLEKMNLR
jgi:hypothetical protein